MLDWIGPPGLSYRPYTIIYTPTLPNHANNNLIKYTHTYTTNTHTQSHVCMHLGEQRLGDPEVVRGVLQPRVEGGGGGRGGAFGPCGAEEDEEVFLLWVLWRGSAGVGTRAATGLRASNGRGVLRIDLQTNRWIDPTRSINPIYQLEKEAATI